MRESNSGSAHAPTIAVLATVALSVVLFFVFTLPQSRKNPPEPAAGDEVAKSVPPTPAPEPVVEPEPEPPATPDFTADPRALMDEVSKRLAAGDIAALAELLGGDAGDAKALAAAFGPGGYESVPGGAPVEVGPVGDASRWMLPVRKRAAGSAVSEIRGEPGNQGAAGEAGPGSEEPPATPSPEVERLYLDLVKTVKPDGSTSWAVRKIHYPPALQDLIAAAGAPLAANARNEQDAMVMAADFITAVTQKDYVTALGACSNESVPEEKIAGLCIVFEEGQFTLRNEKPLIATALGDDKSWVIAHVESPKLEQGSEFGLVMGRRAEGSWQITEINFGRLLDTYVDASDAGKVPYTPIKSQPGAGDLLVLYFEYDGFTLLPRAKRQLEILSGILKADPGKSLTIAGHADALGSEDYNARLSATRAASVKTQLIAFDVPDTQIRTTGFGEAKPWKPNERPDGTDDPKGRAYNRRAELFLDFSDR